MYRLFIANKNYSSWSLRPWLLLSALGIAFEERLELFQPGSNRARFRSFSPAGTVPCLHDDGVVVWDSLAIIEYLAERHAGVWPADPVARAWARCACAEMHAGFSTLRNVCSMSVGLRVRLHEQSPALLGELARIDELWCEGVTRHGGPWLGGASFGAVDAFFAPVVFRVQTYGLPLSPAAQAWLARMLALPAMQQWTRAALAETARDEGHEQDTLAVGTVLEDLRAAAV